MSRFSCSEPSSPSLEALRKGPPLLAASFNVSIYLTEVCLTEKPIGRDGRAALPFAHLMTTCSLAVGKGEKGTATNISN